MSAYLHARGAAPRRIARILAVGLGSGTAMAAVLGTIYYLAILAKPVETISLFCIIGVLGAAAQMAREEILGTLTPLGRDPAERGGELRRGREPAAHDVRGPLEPASASHGPGGDGGGRGDRVCALVRGPRRFPLGLAVGLGFPLVILAAIGLWAWRDISREIRSSEQVPFEVPTGSTLQVTDGSFGAVRLHYPRTDLHEELKRRLYEEGASYSVGTMNGHEVLIVGAEGRARAMKAIGLVERARSPGAR